MQVLLLADTVFSPFPSPTENQPTPAVSAVSGGSLTLREGGQAQKTLFCAEVQLCSSFLPFLPALPMPSCKELDKFRVLRHVRISASAVNMLCTFCSSSIDLMKLQL